MFNPKIKRIHYTLITSHKLSEKDAIYTEQMVNNRIVKELVAPDVTCQPLCICYLKVDATFELKYGLIYMLPTFNGLANEYLYKHLTKFHMVCLTMKQQDIQKNISS